MNQVQKPTTSLLFLFFLFLFLACGSAVQFVDGWLSDFLTNRQMPHETMVWITGDLMRFIVCFLSSHAN